jgi:DNA-binding NarL/FixJ family response regulator
MGYCTFMAAVGPPLTDTRLKLRVLVVDSDPMTRFGLLSVTNLHPLFEVCGEAEDVPQARRLCQEDRPDVILMNFASSQNAGFGVLREFRQPHPPVRLIVFADFGKAILVERAFRAGANVYISVRDQCGDLLLALECLASGKLYVSPHTSEHLLEQMAPPHGRQKRDLVETLSDREVEIFGLIGRKQGPTSIARKLKVSVKTIESHQERIKRKLALRSCTALRRAAQRWAASGERRRLTRIHSGIGEGRHSA